MILEDDSVKLRALEPADALVMWEVESDRSQWLYNGMLAPFSAKSLADYASNYEADPFKAGQIRLVAMRKTDCPASSQPEYMKGCENIGLVDLYDISPSDRNAFVGIYILPNFRGHGLAGKSLDLTCRYAADILNLECLAAKVVEGNESSRRLFEQAGFTHAGTLRKWILCGNRRCDLLYYQKPLR